MKSFLLILSLIFAFGIALTSSSISYSDYMSNSLNTSKIKKNKDHKSHDFNVLNATISLQAKASK
tara:strand:- start:468 stop:662 length:195 start_codon:yes stop_codon:yes gene_type:complete